MMKGSLHHRMLFIAACSLWASVCYSYQFELPFNLPDRIQRAALRGAPKPFKSHRVEAVCRTDLKSKPYWQFDAYVIRYKHRMCHT
jgi:hypothetical protein